MLRAKSAKEKSPFRIRIIMAADSQACSITVDQIPVEVRISHVNTASYEYVGPSASHEEPL